MDHQKSNFLLISDTRRLLRPADITFLKTDGRNSLGTMYQKKYWSFYPSEDNQKISFNVRHPVQSQYSLIIDKESAASWHFSIYRAVGEGGKGVSRGSLAPPKFCPFFKLNLYELYFN